ncbi:YqaJ viral recombinase family protein [Flagellimonas flava]|uniref:YqaJ viral recombinase family protein n=1 Tax=Flagellimonas flava TaxID=570519 RepID=UPI003D64B7A0
MIFHDVEQNSPQWDALRLGKATTSKFGVIMANYGKAFSDTAKKYAHKIAYEQVTGAKEESAGFSNGYMEEGHVWEPIAKEAYEHETFSEVSNGGFCQSEKYENVGGSPDGRILLDNGGIEIKSVIAWTQRQNIRRNSLDPAYKWQKLGNIWLCGWDYCDFISYGYTCTENNKLFIHRILKEDYKDDIAKIEPRLEQFLELVEDEKKYI